MDKTIPLIIGGIGVIGAAFGYAYYVNQQKISVTSPPLTTTTPPSTTTLLLAITPISINSGNSIDINVIMKNGIAGSTVNIKGLPLSETITVDSTGLGSTTVVINKAGSYTVYASSGGIISNSISITVKSNTPPPPPPPPPSYTCYSGRCKTLRLATGQLETFCQAAPYTSSTPCPSGHATPSEACSGVVC